MCLSNAYSGYYAEDIYIAKQDDVPDGQTVGGGDEVTYTITYGPEALNHTNVVIRDYLPEGLTYISSNPEIDYVDVNDGALVWNIGSMAYDDLNSTISLTVNVNKSVGYYTEITNYVTITSDIASAGAEETTAIGDWEDIDVPEYVPGVIYVDAHANGFNNGTSWANAYTDLQDALTRARTRLAADADAVAEIWVADGRYNPGPSLWLDYFDIPSGCEIYGGFAGIETERSQRHWSRYRAILDGHTLNKRIVNITNANDSANPVVLDGFHIQQAGLFAIDINNSSPAISHCVILNNNAGIDIDSNSVPVLTNNVIAINAQSGLSFGTTDYLTEVRNNTIAYNSIGVLVEEGAPGMINNIIWHNDQQVSESCIYTYSCVQDFNDPNNTTTPDANYNITANPLFVSEYNGRDPNSFDWHIDFDNSPCIDQGSDPNLVAGELDIDSNVRIYGMQSDMGASDMGADEAHCNDNYEAADFYNDGMVNLNDFALLSEAWLSVAPADPNNPLNWNPICDLNADDAVNTADLASFLDYWLWQACYNVGGVSAPATVQQSAILAESIAKVEVPVVELTLQEQYSQLDDAIGWLNELYRDPKESLTKDQLNILWDFEDQLANQLDDINDQLQLEAKLIK
ncbi:MAG: DUF11 domain-containing protein [Phycisphaerae bacterium]|nr:DUF11 domain-containing protein [Phycisphaerae bacterium]